MSNLNLTEAMQPPGYLVRQVARQFVEQLTLLHGRANSALRRPTEDLRDEVESIAAATHNLIALAHVLGAASWQPQVFDVATEDA